MIMPEGAGCEAVSQPELARMIDDIAPRQNVRSGFSPRSRSSGVRLPSLRRFA